MLPSLPVSLRRADFHPSLRSTLSTPPAAKDSTSPTWSNLTEGQRNLRDAVRGKITYTNPSTGKVYALKEKTSVLFVRPRGWHLDEAHVTVNGRVASGGLFDFGLYFFHNVHALLQKGSRPYFYLPKLEDYLEARLWNDVFRAAQSYFGVPAGTIRATVLLETITAAFQMEEILYELRDHSLGLNCGRWDYLFSYIKKFKCHGDKIAPDRSHLTMTDTPLLRAYVDRLIYICHKRGTFAMGGMAAQIPIKGNPAENDAAMARIRKDKIREALAGHDGTWVVSVCLLSRTSPLARIVLVSRMRWEFYVIRYSNSQRLYSRSWLTGPPGIGLAREVRVRRIYARAQSNRQEPGPVG